MNDGNRPGEDQGLAPETAANDIRRSLAADVETPWKAFARDSQIACLAEWCQAHGRLLDRATWLGPAEKGGVEHDLWFEPETQRFIKITLPPGYGRQLEVFEGRLHSRWARPLAYLSRWETCNQFFGDDVRFHGVILEDDGPRVVVSQPLVIGERPTVDEISEWMLAYGYERTAAIETAFIHKDTHQGFFDCHQGNFLRGPTGQLFAIDAIPFEVDAKIRTLLCQ